MKEQSPRSTQRRPQVARAPNLQRAHGMFAREDTSEGKGCTQELCFWLPKLPRLGRTYPIPRIMRSLLVLSTGVKKPRLSGQVIDSVSWHLLGATTAICAIHVQ